MSEEILNKVTNVVPTLLVLGATMRVYDETVGKHSPSKQVSIKHMKLL